jgi:APA family basic amino acid/polyamine antiporter
LNERTLNVVENKGSQRELVKGLSVYGATSVVAGIMIGTGIFVVPSIMLQQVGSPLLVIVVWILAGVLSLFGALGYAELGAALPQAGGEYVYVHRVYGPMMGFTYGWTQLVLAKSGSIATIATGFVIYLAYFFPRLNQTLWQAPVGMAGHSLTLRLTGLQIGATLLVVLLSGLNVLGVRRSGRTQTFFTAAKLLVLFTLIVLGLGLGHGSFQHFRTHLAVGPPASLLASFGAATVAALWAYDGWNNLSMVAGEVENPQRNMPLALILGTLLVIAVYVLVNIAYFYVLAPVNAASTTTVAADTARQLMGKAGGTFVTLGVLISCFAALNGSILSGSRIPYAQARDGLFPRFLAGVHPRFHTPAAAIAAQGVIAGLLALTGRYQGLFTKVIFAEFLFYAPVTAGIFILRRRLPGLERPYRTWGYPIVPAVFVVLSVAVLASTLRTQWSDCAWALGLAGSGIPAYFLWRMWSRGLGH